MMAIASERYAVEQVELANRAVSLVWLNRNGYLYYASRHPCLERLMTRLSTEGIPVKIYENVYLSTIDEFIVDLCELGNHIIVFYIDAGNIEIVRRLSDRCAHASIPLHIIWYRDYTYMPLTSELEKSNDDEWARYVVGDRLHIVIDAGAVNPLSDQLLTRLCNRRTESDYQFYITNIDTDNQDHAITIMNQLIQVQLATLSTLCLMTRSASRTFISGKSKHLYPEKIASFIRQHYGEQDAIHTDEIHALLNGWHASLTGIYPRYTLTHCVKHARVDSMRNLNWHALERMLGINSAIIIETADKPAAERLYSEGHGTHRFIHSMYDEARAELDSADYIHSHLYQYYSKGFHEYGLQFDDIYIGEELSFYRLPYHRAEDIPETEFGYLEIESAEDLESLLDDVGSFQQTGKIRKGYVVKSQVLDSCRWLGSGACNLAYLPRISIKQGEVYPCGDHTKLSIGEIQDGYWKLRENAQVHQESELLKRGCRTCPVQDECSKCTVLPPYMTSEQYCEIRRKRAVIHHYFTVLHVLRDLTLRTSVFTGISMNQLVNSSRWHAYYYTYPHVNHTPNKSLYDNLMLFTHPEAKAAYLYHQANGRVAKIKPVVAMIVEARMQRASSQDIVDIIVQKYRVPADNAHDVYMNAIKMLADAGFVHRLPDENFHPNEGEG
ncbi:hypothetical protein FLT15_07795 [Paenibacillus thiaminolyticus]|uniref:hypothetical protein n=2 Tax=Paenibacillus thiaminolyticus TaxID=49283 RepID=UPI001162C2BE|nr:hypothetical protein [Paenibacillus thiaminolyticus]NGP58294.1 hypothetical protein [Paenibacillus thiaminolyticus]